MEGSDSQPSVIRRMHTHSTVNGQVSDYSFAQWGSHCLLDFLTVGGGERGKGGRECV